MVTFYENYLKTNPLNRHQEPGDMIKKHPRNITDTFRPKDEKRKERREAVKERQLRKKEDKRKEIEFLKAMKLQEIRDKIDRIREASGNEDIDIGVSILVLLHIQCQVVVMNSDILVQTRYFISILNNVY